MRSAWSLLAVLALAGCTLLAPPTPPPISSAIGTTTSPGAAAPDCANLTLALDRDVLRAGENVSIRIALANCGSTYLTVRPGGECYHGANLDVSIQQDGGSAYALLAPGNEGSPMEAPPQQMGHSMVCSVPPGDAPVAALVPPGGSESVTLSWNGTALRRVSTLSEHGGVSSYVAERLPAGHVALSASFALGDGRAATADADLMLAFPPRNVTRLLVVDERDWHNATGGEAPAPTFPPCDEASFANGTLVVHGKPVDDYALLRRYHNVSSVVAYEAWSPDGGELFAPASDLVIASVAPSGADLWVNGTRLAPGNDTTLRPPDTMYESVLVLSNAGLVPVVVDGAACAQS